MVKGEDATKRFVAITVDPPLRKDDTDHPHVVIQVVYLIINITQILIISMISRFVFFYVVCRGGLCDKEASVGRENGRSSHTEK